MGRVYCMSDIHGNLDRYLNMLDKIQFSKRDKLYILGDVIDRYPNGIDILRDILAHDNMILLMGNHEKMCYDTLGPERKVGYKQAWMWNGGEPTYYDLIYRMDRTERFHLLYMIARLPYCLDIKVGRRKFHLVHAYPSESDEDKLWTRLDPQWDAPFPDKMTIVGHTPTPYLTDLFDEPHKIWRGKGIIDIDCGCGTQNPFRRLACLRLNDMKVFYV